MTLADVNLLGIVASQFPGELADRLNLELSFKADPYFLRSELRIKNPDRGIDINVVLEPYSYEGHTIKAKVPEVTILHLCTFIT